jgi:glycosyltransferase involved in cell wall biosynthesis
MQYIGSHGADKFIKRSRKPFTVLTCSNLFAAKRVNLVAEAMHTLIKEIPDIKWVHFGDGPKRQELQSLCADIKDAVTFKGYTPHGEVMDYLSSGEASLFISPSASEGLPISVGEAHGFSLPTIATDVGSTCEIQISGTTGDLMSADLSAEDIISLVLKYYNMSDEEYDAICKSTHNFWLENFSCRENGKALAQNLLTF